MTCPRCAGPLDGDLYGPCTDCRAQLRTAAEHRIPQPDPRYGKPEAIPYDPNEPPARPVPHA